MFKYTAHWLLIALLLFCNMFLYAQDKLIPAQLKPFISSITYQSINGQYPKVNYTALSKTLYKVSLQWDIADSVKQDDWQVNIVPAFTPAFHWAPHLTPTEDHIIA